MPHEKFSPLERVLETMTAQAQVRGTLVAGSSVRPSAVPRGAAVSAHTGVTYGVWAGKEQVPGPGGVCA